MSAPDDSAWDAAFRVQRDVALRIPINYVTVPAVSLRAACFAHNQYEDGAFQLCFQNLLGVGFQRFVVDVFWDADRTTWSLCPVSLSSSALSAGVKNAREVDFAGSGLDMPFATGVAVSIWPRVEASSSDLISESDSTITRSQILALGLSSSSLSASTPTTTPEPTNLVGHDAQPLLQVGPYSCTSTITLSFLANILQQYLQMTQTTLEATDQSLILNIHAAASYSAADSPAQQPSSNGLLNPNNLLSNVFSGNLSSYIYTPSRLQNERNNLNESWYDATLENRPILGYYQTSKNTDNNIIASKGWPTESYMEFKKFHRLVLGFGSVDPQMSAYNLSSDSNTIFMPGTIQSLQKTSIESSGKVTSGCIFSPDDLAAPLSFDSSWDVSLAPDLNIGLNPNTADPILAITNLTSCGLSPILNTSLSDITADVNRLPYLAFARSTLWSWAPGEPVNNTDNDSTKGRCAAMHLSPHPGRWRTVDCSSRYRVACQDTDNPFRWTISNDTVTYRNGDTICPPHTAFSVPHTAAENSHLLSVMQSSRRDHADDPVFININTLNVPTCWAVGIGTACPYVAPTNVTKVRLVVVPTVATVIVFVLAALTLFVKCAANRQEDKRGRRRRNIGGWEYEGVPS